MEAKWFGALAGVVLFVVGPLAYASPAGVSSPNAVAIASSDVVADMVPSILNDLTTPGASPMDAHGPDMVMEWTRFDCVDSLAGGALGDEPIISATSPVFERQPGTQIHYIHYLDTEPGECLSAEGMRIGPSGAYIGHYRFAYIDVGELYDQGPVPNGEPTNRLTCDYAFLTQVRSFDCRGTFSSYPGRMHQITITILPESDPARLFAPVPSFGPVWYSLDRTPE